MTGYNPLNSVKVNLESVGICQLDGMRFSDPNCPHGTPEQIARCKEIDERMDNEDIFGHPIQADEWLSSRSFVRIPNDFNHARYEIEEGTEASPIISGGEVLYITNPMGHDDIPF